MRLTLFLYIISVKFRLGIVQLGPTKVRSEKLCQLSLLKCLIVVDSGMRIIDVER